MELRIKEIQLKKSITNVELSKRAKIGVQQIAYYHSGTRKPPLDTLNRIAIALGCEVAELLTVGDNFYHSYDNSGEWQGIRKK